MAGKPRTRPITVQDTMKDDQSLDSHKQTSIIVSQDASGHFSHLQKVVSHEKSRQNSHSIDIVSKASELKIDSTTKHQKSRLDFEADLVAENNAHENSASKRTSLFANQLTVEAANRNEEANSSTIRKNRLTQVRELDGEHQNLRDSESKMSEQAKITSI